MLELSAGTLGVIGLALTVTGGIGGRLLDRWAARGRERQYQQSRLLASIQDAQAHLTRTLFETIGEMRKEVTELRDALDECEGKHAEAAAQLHLLQKELTGLRCAMQQAGVDCPIVGSTQLALTKSP